MVMHCNLLLPSLLLQQQHRVWTLLACWKFIQRKLTYQAWRMQQEHLWCPCTHGHKSLVHQIPGALSLFHDPFIKTESQMLCVIVYETLFLIPLCLCFHIFSLFSTHLSWERKKPPTYSSKKIKKSSVSSGLHTHTSSSSAELAVHDMVNLSGQSSAPGFHFEGDNSFKNLKEKNNLFHLEAPVNSEVRFRLLMLFRTRHQSGASELDVNLNSISRFTVSTCVNYQISLNYWGNQSVILSSDWSWILQLSLRWEDARDAGRRIAAATEAPPAVQPNSDSSLVNSGKHVYGNTMKIPKTLPESWSFKLCWFSINPTAGNLCIWFDSNLNFEKRITKLVQSCFYQLRNISKIS